MTTKQIDINDLINIENIDSSMLKLNKKQW